MSNNTKDEFDSENKQCPSDIFKVLSHIAIFKPLITCIFGNQNDIPSQEERETFLKEEDNFYKIIDYFKNKDNLNIFTEVVASFYLEHKAALDSVGINNNSKNVYSYAIASIRKFIEDEEKGNTVYPNTCIEIGNYIDRLKSIFMEILGEQNNLYCKETKYAKDNNRPKVTGDIKGNLTIPLEHHYSEGSINNFNGIEIAKVNGICIDIDTRRPVTIDTDCEELNGELIGFNSKRKIFDGIIVSEIIVKTEKGTENFCILGDIETMNEKKFHALKDSQGNIIRYFLNPTEINGKEYFEAMLRDKVYSSILNDKFVEYENPKRLFDGFFTKLKNFF